MVKNICRWCRIKIENLVTFNENAWILKQNNTVKISLYTI